MIIKCKNCGGNIEYNINEKEIVCNYCGQKITDFSKFDENSIQSVDSFKKRFDTVEIYKYKCDTCGAEFLGNKFIGNKECMYCGTTNFINLGPNKDFEIDKILPFEISDNDFLKIIIDNHIKLKQVIRMYVPAYIYGDISEPNVCSIFPLGSKMSPKMSSDNLEWDFKKFKDFNPIYLKDNIIDLPAKYKVEFQGKQENENVLMPIYIINYRYIVNGQNGKIRPTQLEEQYAFLNDVTAKNSFIGNLVNYYISKLNRMKKARHTLIRINEEYAKTNEIIKLNKKSLCKIKFEIANNHCVTTEDVDRVLNDDTIKEIDEKKINKNKEMLSTFNSGINYLKKPIRILGALIYIPILLEPIIFLFLIILKSDIKLIRYHGTGTIFIILIQLGIILLYWAMYFTVKTILNRKLVKLPYKILNNLYEIGVD